MSVMLASELPVLAGVLAVLVGELAALVGGLTLLCGGLTGLAIGLAGLDTLTLNLLDPVNLLDLLFCWGYLCCTG